MNKKEKVIIVEIEPEKIDYQELKKVNISLDIVIKKIEENINDAIKVLKEDYGLSDLDLSYIRENKLHKVENRESFDIGQQEEIQYELGIIDGLERLKKELLRKYYKK